jgi:glycosyltransferase involved in cell wall biosynthesis
MANQTRQLAELLRREGAKVEIVQVNLPYRPSWVGRLKGVRALFRLLPYLAMLWEVSGRVRLVHVMANSGWSWHLFAAPAVWIAALRRIPVVVNYRGGEADPFLRRAGRLVVMTMGRAKALLVPSGFLLDVFARYGMDGQVVPNVIDPMRFYPAVRHDDDVAFRHLVVARNLEPIYGVDTALHAFALIHESMLKVRLSVAGTGPEAQRLANLAASLGVAANVRFTGRLDRDQMAELYREADLVLNPSRVDNMPNSILEAMASGVPVVSTDVGGVPYLVEHERTALLVPPDDAEAMAKAALRILHDRTLAIRLRNEGLAECQQYRWEMVRERLLRAYSAALEPS